MSLMARASCSCTSIEDTRFVLSELFAVGDDHDLISAKYLNILLGVRFGGLVAI